MSGKKKVPTNQADFLIYNDGYFAAVGDQEKRNKQLDKALKKLDSIRESLFGLSGHFDDQGTMDFAKGYLLEEVENLLKIYDLDPNTMYPVMGNYFDEHGGI